GTDTLNDASGSDTVDFSAITAGTNVTINLAATGVTVGAANVRWGIANLIENAVGGAGNDSLTDSSLANYIAGNAGNDTIIAGAGNDTFDGGSGNDLYSFYDGWGHDSIIDSAGAVDNLDFYNTPVVANLTINLTVGAGNEVTDGTNTVDWSTATFESLDAGIG